MIERIVSTDSRDALQNGQLFVASERPERFDAHDYLSDQAKAKRCRCGASTVARCRVVDTELPHILVPRYRGLRWVQMGALNRAWLQDRQTASVAL